MSIISNQGRKLEIRSYLLIYILSKSDETCFDLSGIYVFSFKKLSKEHISLRNRHHRRKPGQITLRIC